MRARIVAVIFLCMGTSLFGSDGTTVQDTASSPAAQKTWGGLDLFSCSLNLKSKKQVRWYLFHRAGSVSVTLGLKHGPVTFPLWDWMRHREWLRILDEDGKVVYQMRPLKIKGQEITVDNGKGETETYEIQPNDEPPKERVPEKGTGK